MTLHRDKRRTLFVNLAPNCRFDGSLQLNDALFQLCFSAPTGLFKSYNTSMSGNCPITNFPEMSSDLYAQIWSGLKVTGVEVVKIWEPPSTQLKEERHFFSLLLDSVRFWHQNRSKHWLKVDSHDRLYRFFLRDCFPKRHRNCNEDLELFEFVEVTVKNWTVLSEWKVENRFSTKKPFFLGVFGSLLTLETNWQLSWIRRDWYNWNLPRVVVCVWADQGGGLGLPMY